MINRADPVDCGCTDCCTGYSRPINRLDEDELWRVHLGIIENASGEKLKIDVSIDYE